MDAAVHLCQHYPENLRFTKMMTMTMTHSDKVFTRGSTLPYGLEWGSRCFIENTLSDLQNSV